MTLVSTLRVGTAARKLNWPIRTVHGRLSRGRELQRGRLCLRGMAVPEFVSSAIERAAKRRESAVSEALLVSTLSLKKGQRS